MGFGVTADKSEKDVDYEISDNFLEDFVRFSRANQVVNEEQACVVQMGIATGMMKDHEFFTSIIVTGNASSGKSYMLDNVNFASLEYAQDVHEYIYEMTGSSDQGGINDEEIDEARVAYFHELQKIPDEMLEFIKTVAEDGKFIYGRSTSDSDAVGGFSTEKFSRDPLPVVFSFADENDAAAGKDQELRSRTVEVKVEEGPEKNEAVHDMKWGGTHITMPGREHEYIFDNPDMEHAVKAHLRDMPQDVDVVIPYGEGDYDGDDWRAADVVKPMFNFAATDSTRASTNLAGLTMGSAILNYHNRDAVCEKCQAVYGPDDAQGHDYECPDCEDAALHIIVEPTDVANVIACRQTLLATTHGLTEKKFAVLDAIAARGGKADAKGTAVQATKQDIIDEIQENEDIASMNKTQIGNILEELDENLIINKKDNPDDRRQNLYVYDGSQVFEAPNIYEHYDKFKDVQDPIRGQPIEATVEEQLDELDAKLDVGETAKHDVSSDDADGSLSDFSDGGSATPADLSDDAEIVAERLSDVLSGYKVPEEVMAENSLRTAHMVGDTPVEYDGDYVRPERAPNGGDRVDGFMRPEGHFDDADNFNEVEARVEDAIAELREKGVMQMEEQSDGSVLVTVDS